MKEQTVLKKELTEDELAAKIEKLDKKIKDREADRYYADSFEQASQISDDISDLFTERNALKATLDKMLSAEDKDNNTYYEIDQKWLEENKDVVDDLLHKNWEKATDGTSNAEYLSFEYEGMAISNPLMDELGRFPLTLEQSIEKYGEQNVMKFLSDFKAQQVNPNVVTLFSDDTALLKELKETYGKSVVIEDNIEHLRDMQYEIEYCLDYNEHPSAFVVAVGRDKERIDRLHSMCEENYCCCNSYCHMEQKNSETYTLDDYVHNLETMKSFISDLEENKTSAKFDMWFFFRRT